MTVPLLQITGATKRFAGVTALDDVALEVRAGEVLALVGENGAGKSTLMKLLSGVYTPDSGEIRLNGEVVHPANPRHAQELGISIIHQELNLVADLTVAQNIFLGREGARFGVLRERDLVRRTRELLRKLGLELDPNARLGDLSVASAQMVEIAKALSFDSRVLIMDEPTAALNDVEVAALMRIIRRFVSTTTAVIYISHRMNELPEIADRISVLRDGRSIGTLDGTAPMREVISLMVGRSLDTAKRPGPAPKDAPVRLSVENLSTKTLLRNVSFELHAGEILGFAGLMGAGRTETARAIIGADQRSGGRITVNGTEARVRQPSQAAKLGIGYLSEDRKQLGVLVEQTVRENIMLASTREFYSAAGIANDRRMRQVATEQVGKLRIKTPSIDQLVRYLSGGNQQKVAIAKWLVRDCDVLIFDEPTRGIDIGAKDEIYELLERLAGAGKAIMMISSELPEVLRLAHRIAVMCDGRLTGILENAEANQERIMELATRFSDEGLVAR